MPMSVVYATVNGRLVQENRGGVVTRYVPDTLGSVIQTRDAAGNQSSSTTYWPFGEVRTQTGNNPSPWGFCGIWGYFKDAASRLYVRARTLRPDLSRWMTVDPLWPREKAYTYCYANPYAYIDPSGLIVEVCLRPLDPPVPEKPGYAHWFFNTTLCGARGYESGGLLPGWNPNAGGYKVNCYVLTTDPNIEACICREAQSTSAGGGTWLPGTGLPGYYPIPTPIGPLPLPKKSVGGNKRSPPGSGGYDFYKHNCQDFVQKVIEKCMGGRLDWPEMGGTKPSPKLPVISCGPPTCPKREG
jgi:RHS repeat-associated protein